MSENLTVHTFFVLLVFKKGGWSFWWLCGLYPACLLLHCFYTNHHISTVSNVEILIIKRIWINVETYNLQCVWMTLWILSCSTPLMLGMFISIFVILGHVLFICAIYSCAKVSYCLTWSFTFVQYMRNLDYNLNSNEYEINEALESEPFIGVFCFNHSFPPHCLSCNFLISAFPSYPADGVKEDRSIPPQQHARWSLYDSTSLHFCLC